MTYVLFFMLMTILVIVSFAVYKSALATPVKMATFPLLILFSVLVTYHYTLSLGAPIKHKPVGEWEYIHHEAYATEIELWTFEDRGSRLYVFPDSDAVREMLELAQKRSGEGQTIYGEFEIDANDGDSKSEVLTLVNRPHKIDTKGR